MPDPELGERTCVYVVPRPETPLPTLDELVQLFAERGLAKHKWPEHLELVDELPVTSVGKVDKHALREDIAAKLGQPPVA
jgi:non-ribosomal peptide synthetase component E (peptide arylation enzyme)